MLFGQDTPTITALKPTQRDASRISVFVDKKHRITMADKSVHELGLRVGDAWTDLLEREAMKAAGLDKCMMHAMSRLNRKAYSRRELDTKLRQLEHPDHVRAAVLDRLEEAGYLDDQAYAEALVRETLRGKPAGPRLLKQKLFQKGVPQDVAQRVLAEQSPDAETQTEQAIALAQQKAAAPSMQRLDAAAQRRRLQGLLQRRGFDFDAISAALDALRDGMQTENES